MSIVSLLFQLCLLALLLGLVVLAIVLLVRHHKKQTGAGVHLEIKPAASSVSEAKLPLSQVLKAHRERCGMTQEFVAESLNITRQAVSKWENGSSEPSTSNLLALAKLYGVSAATLLDQIQ